MDVFDAVSVPVVPLEFELVSEVTSEVESVILVESVGFPHEESKKAPRTRVRKILLSGLLVRM
ncbi:MAG: hypothetical protein PHV19_00260 [Bacilli bacterium]|nr:hypothetical protein [Bacilli bacterium]